jgi:cell division protein FtsL
MNMKQNTIKKNSEKLTPTVEILIILALGFAVFLVAGYYDIFENFVAFSTQHEDWELDEILTVSIFLVFASAVFSLRRWLELRQSETLLSQQNKELNDLLSEVKQLRGIFPICAECKKIRDDRGFWHQVETYIRDHSEAEFSHSVCPECMKKLYPEFAEDE